MELITDTVAEARQRAVAATIAEIHAVLAAEGATPSGLEQVKDALVALAARPELFPDTHFPEPAPDRADALYGLAEDPDRSNALYVYRPRPGYQTPPHNHATWAVVVGIEGCEPNRIYRRLDDGRRAGHAVLELEERLTIGPGDGLWLLPDGVHSIHIAGDRPIKHLHMYGRTLLDLPTRLDFDPRAETCWRPMRRPTVLTPRGD